MLHQSVLSVPARAPRQSVQMACNVIESTRAQEADPEARSSTGNHSEGVPPTTHYIVPGHGPALHNNADVHHKG